MPWAVVGVCALGAVLRLARLGSLPPALFRDEAEKGYTAWCILETGRDVAGHFLPLFVNVFGVTTSALYQYAAVPFLALVGVNEWGVRLPAALIGILTVVLNYRLMRDERGYRVAFWATLFLALSPWHIVFSRWAQQGIFLPLFLICAMLGWRAFLRGSRLGLALGSAALGLAIFAYDVARLFVPMMMGVVVLLYWRELSRRWLQTTVAGVVFCIVVSPVAVLLVGSTDASQARFRAISIFSDNLSALHVMILFLKNYTSHFSPAFLLLSGDGELRHGAGVGVLNGVEFVALVGGVVALARSRRREDLLWLAWLLLFPVAASLTKIGIPHALRCIVAIPAIQNVAAAGIDELHRFVDRLRSPADAETVAFSLRSRTAAVTLLLVLAGFAPFARSYYVTYARRSAVNWQYGIKQALELLRPDRERIDQVVFYNVTGYEYLAAFYDRVSPIELSSHGLGLTRFTAPPFNYPLNRLYADRERAMAVITLPIYPGPDGGRGYPIHAPGSAEPVAVVYLSEALCKRLGVQ